MKQIKTIKTSDEGKKIWNKNDEDSKEQNFSTLNSFYFIVFTQVLFIVTPFTH